MPNVRYGIKNVIQQLCYEATENNRPSYHIRLVKTHIKYLIQQSHEKATENTHS